MTDENNNKAVQMIGEMRLEVSEIRGTVSMLQPVLEQVGEALQRLARIDATIAARDDAFVSLSRRMEAHDERLTIRIDALDERVRTNEIGHGQTATRWGVLMALATLVGSGLVSAVVSLFKIGAS
jgi:hypothetical protein